MRTVRKWVFSWHFRQLQNNEKRVLPVYTTWTSNTAQGLGVFPLKEEETLERPRGIEAQEKGDS